MQCNLRFQFNPPATICHEPAIWLLYWKEARHLVQPSINFILVHSMQKGIYVRPAEFAVYLEYSDNLQRTPDVKPDVRSLPFKIPLFQSLRSVKKATPPPPPPPPPPGGKDQSTARQASFPPAAAYSALQLKSNTLKAVPTIIITSGSSTDTGPTEVKSTSSDVIDAVNSTGGLALLSITPATRESSRRRTLSIPSAAV